MAESPCGRVRTPPQRVVDAPSEPPPNRHCTIGEDAFTQQHGSPRSGTPSRSVRAPSQGAP
eukprot:1711981-Alexandrium_andersonii.AAC.1